MAELYQKYVREYEKLKVKYAIPEDETRGRLTFEAFRDGFKDYADLLRKDKYITNAEASVKLAEDSVFSTSRTGAENLRKYAKKYLDKDISFVELRINKGNISGELLTELKAKYDNGEIEVGDLSWAKWSSLYIFGSD